MGCHGGSSGGCSEDRGSFWVLPVLSELLWAISNTANLSNPAALAAAASAATPPQPARARVFAMGYPSSAWGVCHELLLFVEIDIAFFRSEPLSYSSSMRRGAGHFVGRHSCACGPAGQSKKRLQNIWTRQRSA